MTTTKNGPALAAVPPLQPAADGSPPPTDPALALVIETARRRCAEQIADSVINFERVGGVEWREGARSMHEGTIAGRLALLRRLHDPVYLRQLGDALTKGELPRNAEEIEHQREKEEERARARAEREAKERAAAEEEQRAEQPPGAAGNDKAQPPEPEAVIY